MDRLPCGTVFLLGELAWDYETCLPCYYLTYTYVYCFINSLLFILTHPKFKTNYDHRLAVILFFAFMAIVGMLEGMQIAFFAVAKMTEEDRARAPWAKKTCDLLFEGDGRNLPGFMVGRQMCVTMCFFIVARVTTIKLKDGDDNIFNVPDGMQAFFETGLLGALITTIIASITWQLVASAFPMAFLSTPLTYVLLRFCLILEWTGLCQGSWVVARLHKKIVGFKRDEVYIGTAEERAENRKNDPLSDNGDHDEDDYNVKPGHLYPGVPTLPPDFKMRMRSVEDIEELERELMEHKNDVEMRLVQLDMEKERLWKEQHPNQGVSSLRTNNREMVVEEPAEQALNCCGA